MQKLTLLVLTVITLLQAPTTRCNYAVEETTPMYIQPTICPCEYKFWPVCGSDGVTYTNQCVLDCSSNIEGKKGRPPVTTVDDSKCTRCVCQQIDLPVCTLDGLTYPNECELSCENIKRIREKLPIVYLAYRTPCLGPPCGCTTVASPVCGTDNVLYRNLCVLNCANINAKTRGLPAIELQNVGACLDGCECPDIDEPVCGSDGRKYNNPCRLACRNKKIYASATSPATVISNKVCLTCPCERIFKPVCGSDGLLKPQTFPNICELNCEAKRTNNPSLKVIAEGVCPKCFCTDTNYPVCGTDCKTYKNECELRCSNYYRKDGELISVFHSGACEEENCDCSQCPKEYQPMCGDNKVTYWNLCWLNCNSNCRKERGLSPIYLAARGWCYM